MYLKTLYFVVLAIIPAVIEGQDDLSQDSRLALKVAMDKISNITDGGLWVLVPSNVSLDELQINSANYNLFKLNTDPLMGAPGDAESSGADLGAEERQSRGEHLGHRSARKMNLFKNVLSKPKVSPLYLINGTVCRFVNQQPICTTLSTTGLLRPNQQQGGGFLNQQNQNLNQIQNGNVQQRQVAPNQPGQFNQQGFRPAAIMDDETSTINVESSLSAGNTTATGDQQQYPNRPQANRPVSYVVSRRPLNLLAFGRPFRQYQFTSRRANHQ